MIKILFVIILFTITSCSFNKSNYNYNEKPESIAVQFFMEEFLPNIGKYEELSLLKREEVNDLLFNNIYIRDSICRYSGTLNGFENIYPKIDNVYAECTKITNDKLINVISVEEFYTDTCMNNSTLIEISIPARYEFGYHVVVFLKKKFDNSQTRFFDIIIDLKKQEVYTNVFGIER